MTLPLSQMTLLRPRSLEQALRLLGEEPTLKPLAGCTDVYVALQFGQPGAGRYLDLWGLDELRGIRRQRDGRLTVGALCTWTELQGSALVRRHLPMLAEAAREVGGPQVQNRGTLGGNVANGSPAGDGLPVLAAAEATVVLGSARGQRRLPFTSFYTGYRSTQRRDDELILSFELEPFEGRQWFRKVGTRAAQAISKVVMAAVRAPRPRLALGSVAPTVLRLPRTEAALAAGAALEECQRLLQAEIAPIDDVRSTAAYRRHVCSALLARFWTETAPPLRGKRR